MCLQARFKSHLLPFDFPTQVIQGMCVKTLASKFSPSLVEGAEKSSKSFLHFPSIFYLWLGGAAKQVLMNCNQQGRKKVLSVESKKCAVWMLIHELWEGISDH